MTVELIEFDATDANQHESFFHNIKARVDVVIAAFRYLGDQSDAVHNFDECRSILETNFVGAVSILNNVASEFKERRSGVIIGIASVAGDRARGSNYTYGSAKAGFITYLSGLRNEW